MSRGGATVAGASLFDIAHHTVQTPRVTELGCPNLVCGDKNPHYSILHVDAKSETLIIGRQNSILQAPLRNISHAVKSAQLEIDSNRMLSCQTSGKTDFECQNHPQYLLWHPIEKHFVICATHAGEPRRYTFDLASNSLTPLHRYSGLRFCAFDPQFNSTAVMTSSTGNPLNQAAIVSATFKDSNGIQPVIFRPEINEQLAPKMQTISAAQWLDNPQFVGSFEHKDHVYIFFREVAQRGRSIQSRVARVCKSDVGSYPVLTDSWTTYSKARLNCSLPGDYPYYFNEIQSVHQFQGTGGEVKQFVAAVFKTNENAILASALCVFAMDDIEEVFRGEFAEETEFGIMRPVAEDTVPTNPRPGTCVEKSSALSPDHMKFIKAHPMMFDAVDAVFKRPVFNRGGIDLQSVTTDSVQTKDGRPVYVHFLGSADGRLFRVVQDGGGRFFSEDGGGGVRFRSEDGGGGGVRFRSEDSSSDSLPTNYYNKHNGIYGRRAGNGGGGGGGKGGGGGGGGVGIEEEFDFHSIDGVRDAGRLLSVYEVDKGKAVDKVAVWRKTGENGRLYLASSSSLIQVSVHNCESYASCGLCAQDPYCAWTHVGTCVKTHPKVDKENPSVIQLVHSSRKEIVNNCRPFVNAMTTSSPPRMSESLDRELATMTSSSSSSGGGDFFHRPIEVDKGHADVISGSLEIHKVEIDKGETKLLNCKERFHNINSMNMYWTFGDEEISVGGSDKKVLTADGNLFLHDVDAGETGIYRCRQRSTNDVVVTFNVRVETEDCNRQCISNDHYKRQYQEWCSRFSEYKKAFDEWNACKERACPSR